jgi:hypothetical protein
MRAAPSLLASLFSVAPLLACGSDKSDDSCKPDDADGIVNQNITVALKVDDTSFQPAIVKTQNSSTITLTLTNAGTKPHGFGVDCLATPNSNGCPTTSCFPAEATIAPVAPGASATVKFITPPVEGIYTYRSAAPGDTATGQFILQ